MATLMTSPDATRFAIVDLTSAGYTAIIRALQDALDQEITADKRMLIVSILSDLDS